MEILAEVLRSAGASGSGGAIFLKAPNMVIQSGVTICANGGAGPTGITGTAAIHLMVENLEVLQEVVVVSISKPANLSLIIPTPLIQTSPPPAVKVIIQGMEQTGLSKLSSTSQFTVFYHRYPHH